MSRIIGWVVIVATLAAACGADGERVVVAAGTTLVDSGMVDALARSYEADHPGVEISVAGRATREALELGGRGAADLMITHAPEQERAFLTVNPDATARLLFSSRFLLVGPAPRAETLAGLRAVDALRRIATNAWDFVSRADGSGTYDRERALWAEAAILPDGESWYVETGQGMGNSLQVADQREAFILVEEGTFLSASDRLRLRPVELAGGGSAADNPYTGIVLESDGAAGQFLEWLVSPRGRTALAEANQAIFAREIYVP